MLRTSWEGSTFGWICSHFSKHRTESSFEKNSTHLWLHGPGVLNMGLSLDCTLVCPNHNTTCFEWKKQDYLYGSWRTWNIWRTTIQLEHKEEKIVSRGNLARSFSNNVAGFKKDLACLHFIWYNVCSFIH